MQSKEVLYWYENIAFNIVQKRQNETRKYIITNKELFHVSTLNKTGEEPFWIWFNEMYLIILDVSDLEK